MPGPAAAPQVVGQTCGWQAGGSDIGSTASRGSAAAQLVDLMAGHLREPTVADIG
ncbi:MAG: hypothetical protein SGI84_00980 [Gemmatimonadota bacterium]|nr:hypothetical protein [Gemmatimonadota bacterium]